MTQRDLLLQIGKRGLKTGMENGVIWCEIRSCFEEPGGTPTKNFE